MRVAYHSTGSALSAYALDAWLTATKAAIGSVSSPGVLINVPAPAPPWRFDSVSAAADRTTLGGVDWSRVDHTRRRGTWRWPNLSAAHATLWRALDVATLGCRVPFVIELPFTSTSYAVIAAPGVVLQLITGGASGRYDMEPLELREVP